MSLFVRVIAAPTILAAALLVATHATGTDPAAQAASSRTAAPMVVMSPTDLAGAYAGAHGLTSCDAPEDAALTDVFLATSVESPGAIVQITLDEALASAGKRHVLLACQE